MSYTLTFTSSQFVYAGRSYPEIPIIVNSKTNIFVDYAFGYFRSLVIFDKLEVTSVKTYASAIALFFNFLGKKDFLEIVDKDLIAWDNHQKAKGVSDLTRCSRCDAVFDLYVWAELNGVVKHALKLPGVNDTENFVPRLTAKTAKSPGKLQRRTSRSGIVSAVRPRVSAPDLQPTPDAADLTKLFVAADNENNLSLTKRNHLLIQWYSQVGVRRMEWGNLTVEQIPSWTKIDELFSKSLVYELRLTKTKGGNGRYVGVIPDLLERTREYIEDPRREIVVRFKKLKGIAYFEPDEIFLSSKTGLPLNFTAISNLLTSLFKQAGVEGHGHRLRATYLTRLFDAEIAAEELRLATHPGSKAQIDWELVLRKVADRAGHKNIDSLRPYLTAAKKRYTRDPGLVDPVTVQQQVDFKKQELALLEKRIAELKEEHERVKTGLTPSLPG
jgi:integrase